MTSGIHHVTAMCGDAQTNIDFYAGVLALRLAKVTVNFDDPSTYHLYYGDGTGAPGSAMTFFPWPNAPKGQIGTGQVGATAFSVPAGSLDFWTARLQSAGLHPDKFERFGAVGLSFRDPDGLVLELIEAQDGREPWVTTEVGQDVAIRGFHSTTLLSANPESTLDTLEALGFVQQGIEGGRVRLDTGHGGPHQIVDVMTGPIQKGYGGVGTVHHIAFRAEDDDNQDELSRAAESKGFMPTTVQERCYFRSVYFRESGRILFEIATDQPGFTIDEDTTALGSALRLPDWFEPHREKIEASLVPVTTPAGVTIP